MTVYKMGENFYMLVTNATPRERDWQWITSIQQERKFDCSLKDVSDETGKLDLQGPRSEEILQKLTEADLKTLRFYHFCEAPVGGIPAIISRSGYTGEDGFEIYAAGNVIGEIWDKLMTVGAGLGLQPVGLGARDTLRMEGGMMLNGQDMDETVSPFEVPYSWIVDAHKEFVGKKALMARKNSGRGNKLVGIEMTGRGIARHGYKVFHKAKEIGMVTSGTFSPTLNKAIGLAFIDIDFSAPDTQIEVAIRDTMTPAKIVKLPFYKRER